MQVTGEYCLAFMVIIDRGKGGLRVCWMWRFEMWLRESSVSEKYAASSKTRRQNGGEIIIIIIISLVTNLFFLVILLNQQ